MSTIAKFSLDEYHRMIAGGVFDGPNRRRVELIRGEIREMNPIGPDHCDIVARLTRWSFAVAPQDEILVRVQSPIKLAAAKSEPEPDIAWVVNKRYRRGHPTAAEVRLLIEVARASLEYDSGEKADLYAQAGIQECWIVNVVENTIDVRREPQPDGYRSNQTFAAGQSVHPLAVPDAALNIDWLFDESN
jgi:Uma2 family endonuclease